MPPARRAKDGRFAFQIDERSLAVSLEPDGTISEATLNELAVAIGAALQNRPRRDALIVRGAVERAVNRQAGAGYGVRGMRGAAGG